MNKQELLAELHQALMHGVLTEDDLRPFISERPVNHKVLAKEKPTSRLSAVDVMFYVAGIVLFTAIMSIIAQSWNDGDYLLHVLLSAGVGSLLWVLAYVLVKSPQQSDLRRGLTNSLLLTGSLSIVVGGYIISNELIGGFDEINYFAGAITFAILGGLHVGFDRLIRRNLILLLGVFLAVAAFPALLFGILQYSDVPLDLWCIVFILAAGVLAYATRVVAKLNPDRPQLRSAFDSLAAFIALMSMYVASYGDLGALWLVALIGGVLGMFYLSILAQNKHLLGNASFFLVLTVITISFKYFSGYGATTSLIISAIGLLGSAAVASTINKKYFKKPE